MSMNTNKFKHMIDIEAENIYNNYTEPKQKVNNNVKMYSEAELSKNNEMQFLGDISKYGEILDSSLFFNYDEDDIKNGDIFTDKEYIEKDVRKMMVNYFGNIFLEKVKDEQEDSIYVARTPSKLMKEFRYIILHVNRNNESIGNVKRLMNLKWKCLQTRQIPDRYNTTLKIQDYTANDIYPYNTEIILAQQDEKKSIYTCPNYPVLEVVLLNKKTDSFMYPKKGSICSALETYKTIMYFV